jgi:hypothetical protein
MHSTIFLTVCTEAKQEASTKREKNPKSTGMRFKKLFYSTFTHFPKYDSLVGGGVVL